MDVRLGPVSPEPVCLDCEATLCFEPGKAPCACEEPWVAPDGSCWLWFPVLDEWTGWMPGEDGVWNLPEAEFRKLYPEAPHG